MIKNNYYASVKMDSTTIHKYGEVEFAAHVKYEKPQFDVKPLYNVPDYNEGLPPMPPNGGLYRGPQGYHPWSNIPLYPTEANYINNVLKSANPPQEAHSMYINGNRGGNNYTPKLNVGELHINGKPTGIHGIIKTTL